MTPIGRRIFLAAVGGLLALAVVGAALTGWRRLVDADLRAAHAVSTANRQWTHAVDQGSARIRAAIDAAADSQNTADLAAEGIRLVDFYDQALQVSGAWPTGAEASLLDNRRLLELVSAGEPFQIIDGAGGAVRLLVGGPLAHPTAGRAGFVASASLEPVLDDVAHTEGGSAFVIDDRGRPLARSGPLDWTKLRQALPEHPGNVATLWSGGQVIELVSMPLSERPGSGSIALARDVTLERHLLDVVDGLSAGILIITGLLVLLALHWLLCRLTRPLDAAIDAMAALAEGDTGVEVLGDGRRDEIGRMARSVRVFRDHMRTSLSTEQRRLRQWQRQLDFIRLQIRNLAATLPEDGRALLFADLERIGDLDGDGGQSLAVALELMTGKVLEQHARLDELVAELKTALTQKAELFQFKEKVAIARRIQENMLPRGLGPESRFAAAAALVPADQFDGGFYDYVPMPHGRLAVVLGQPAGGELAAGFVAATARTSLKVLLSAGMHPADALTRTASLLSGDEAADGLAMAACVFDPDQRQIHWAAAGIDPPLLLRRLGDAIAAPFAAGGVLRPRQPADISAGGLAMMPQATVVFVSPAITEDCQGNAGQNRLLEALRNAPDASPQGVLATLRLEGLLSSHMRNRRDRFCVVLKPKD